MNNQSNIERVVMRRIFLIRMFRPFISSGTLAVLIFIFASWGIGREVWVARVLQNAPKNLTDLPRFYLDAFDHTRLIVQALLLLAFTALIYSVRKFSRALSTSFVTKTT